MDFHSLARKELQALCKKNKIPANMTNVAMADALKALEKVEGLDELINDATRSDPHESPEKTTNAEPRTAGRTSTRRKPIKVEPESSQPLTRTRRATRITVAEGAEQENKNVNLPETPAMPASRRRAPAASARQKIDSQLMESVEDEKSEVIETPALKSSRRKAPAVSTKKKIEPLKSELSVQRVYGTRQSVRLLEKTMAGLSLKETRRVEAVKIEGLGEETEEIEQEKNVPGGDSEVISCQDINETLGESELKHEVQEDKSNGHEVNESESEVLTCQDINETLDQSELKHEVQEDNMSNGHEVNESESEVLTCQDINETLDQSELKHEVQEDNMSNGHEVNESESEVLTCQDINEILGESELKHQVQEDNKSNGREVNELESDVLSCQYLDESQENENKKKDEVQEDNKTNDHEMEDDSGVLVQNFDQPFGTESEMKDELHEDRKSVDCEGDSDVLFQDKDPLLKNGSETKIEFQEDENRNDHELVVCSAKLEMASEPCTDLDNYLNANDEDDNDSSDELFSSKDESSEKIIDVNHESINENGLVAVIGHYEMLNASVKPETEGELNENQDSLIVEASDNNSACLMETEDTSVEVMNSLTPKIPEVVDKGSEMDSMEDDRDDDLLSNADTEEDSDVNDIEEESSDGSEPDEASSSDGSELDESSDELDETSDDSESDEVSDDSFTSEVQQNKSTEEVQKAPLTLEADCEMSQSGNEKCKKADVVNGNVVEAEESDPVETPKSAKSSPFCPLVSDTEKQICDKVTVGMVSSPFAANTIQGQFPRPTESTPRKSSTKKLTTNQKIIHPDIINKENIDSSGRKVEPKKDKMKKKKEAADELREKSLRELSKMLKETLEITSKKNNESKNVSKVGNRPALQKLPENCTARAEAENEN
ncbi:glutamic acid-rich protein isoform X4 [Jatropha curcas]|uniref:glutamic acid-rich protein isoform X4 n=1 Tax=Jatropha curcas TaxID=180498 RepID=UPI001895B100|nr:glutamic acid-rich protein isoform X4 [Jatropha curcas]